MPIRPDQSHHEVDRMKKQLDATFERYERSLTHVPLDLQQDLHLYMCIRLSGYLEQLLHQAICAFIAKQSSPAAQSFAFSFFKNAPNLQPNALEQLIGRLGEGWAREIKALLDEENNRTLLGTLLKIRNDTAHGRSYGGAVTNLRTYKVLVDKIHWWVVDYMIMDRARAHHRS